MCSMCKVTTIITVVVLTHVQVSTQELDAQRSKSKAVDDLLINLVSRLSDWALKVSPRRTGHTTMPTSNIHPRSTPTARQSRARWFHTRRTAASAKGPSVEDEPATAEKQENFYLDKFKAFQKSFGEAQKNFGEEMWDFAYGKKERKWSPDRRPESERGKAAGPSPDSLLSWGSEDSIMRYQLMRQQALDPENKFDLSQLDGVGLGSAATSLYGESAKADDDVNADLAQRMKLAQVPTGSGRRLDSPVELAELVRGKYGFYYDVAILKNAGSVAFNLYGRALGMKNFPYTEEQYLSKLEEVIDLLDQLDQAWYVKKFLLSPIAPRNGLPSTPKADTAVTVRLNLSPTWDDEQCNMIVDAWLALRGRRF